MLPCVVELLILLSEAAVALLADKPDVELSALGSSLSLLQVGLSLLQGGLQLIALHLQAPALLVSLMDAAASFTHLVSQVLDLS